MISTRAVLQALSVLITLSACSSWRSLVGRCDQPTDAPAVRRAAVATLQDSSTAQLVVAIRGDRIEAETPVGASVLVIATSGDTVRQFVARPGPVTLRARPGAHTVLVRALGYRPVRGRVVLRGSYSDSLIVVLREQTGDCRPLKDLTTGSAPAMARRLVPMAAGMAAIPR